MQTVREAIVWARSELRTAGSATPGLDTDLLLALVLHCGRVELYRDSERNLTAGEVARFRSLVAARCEGRPVAYLTGRREFMGLDFLVTPAVLVPRPETELLVEEGLHLLAAILKPEPLVVDVGTGSGAVAVSLAWHLPSARVLATDFSEAALAVARENALRHGVGPRVEFFQGDLLTPVPAALAGRVDLILANLPYIATSELETLPREVRFEPQTALDGGPDGLDLYRRLVPQAQRLLRPGGHLLLEIGPGQGEVALTLVDKPLWESGLLRDLAHRERVITARKN